MSNSERRKSTASDCGISPPTRESCPADADVDVDVGIGWIAWTENSDTPAFGIAGSSCESEEHSSPTDDTTKPSSNTQSPPEEWDEELLHTLSTLDDAALLSFSVDDQPSMSELPDSDAVLGPHEIDLEHDGCQNEFSPGTPDAPLLHGNQDCATSSQLQPSTRYPTPPEQEDYTQPAFPHQLVDLPNELVAIYFSVVCPILSTFDSEQNVFRVFVHQRWQHSVLMLHTIQSMAAAKLAWFMPEMKAQAFEYRVLALNTLSSDVSKASGWNTELLFIVLMLGISSCWFDISDLGVVHLEAVQQAILNNKVEYSTGLHNVSFFKNALTYWEMVSCVVSDNVTFHNYSNVASPLPEPLTPLCVTRIRPHPWTGVASEPQALFTRITRQIRSSRSFEPTAITSSLDNPHDFSDAVRALDQEIWACNLPGLHDITNIGDENTPAIHHLLLAEAYMFANLYQLYSIFANVRRNRVKSIKRTSELHHASQRSWAEGQVSSWASMLRRDDGTETWLRFLGRSIIIRLQQIQTTSGTGCVQALLLLVAATSLSASSEPRENDEEQEEILEERRFVLNRLSFLSESNLSEPIKHVQSVVLEIFKRLDVGIDVFWMDVLQSMGTLTIIG
ncbi:hypothetical protein ACHAPT_006859 [Fusarium lateritium]